MAMETQTFYTTVGAISFTLLGLWWVVVMGRETWQVNLARRRMAYAISLHFALPGAMSILSLVAPDVGLLWRVSFVSASALGLILAVALVPGLVTGLGLGLTALQVEAIVVSILVFFGVQAAWILMIEPLRTDIPPADLPPG